MSQILTTDFPSILNQMLASYQASQNVSSLRVGGPALSILESSAQAISRSVSDFCNLLVSLDLNSAFGGALDLLAAQEGLSRQSALASSGRITVRDSSFTKVAGVLIAGQSYAAGATVLLVRGASFPATGSVYVGSGSKKEGPLLYSAATVVGSYTQLTLVSGLTLNHAPSESVVLAQGGIRTVPLGTIVSTASPTSVGGISFALQDNAIIEDGDTESNEVLVLAQTTGQNTNVAANSVVFFASTPFVGASCNNALAFSNGQDQESDESLRSRIRKARFSKVKGTGTAIESALVGATDGTDVIQSVAMSKDGQKLLVFIDNGNALESSFGGVAFENICPSALGGERIFSLSGTRPVATAYTSTSAAAPFALSDGDDLVVQVGQDSHRIIFSSNDFVNINQASATEVASAINKAGTSVQARTIDGLTKVFVTGNANEILVTGGSAQNALSFSEQVNRTLFLYKNDVLLQQDGRDAVLESTNQSSWPALSSGETLVLSVDGTSAVTYTFTDADFVAAGFGSVGVSSASLNQWVAVINAKVAGVTASTDNVSLVLSSNLGQSNRAGLSITGGTLATKGVWPTESVIGQSSDYSLDRYIGQLSLSQPLVEGDVLTAATLYTVAHQDSIPFSAVTFATDANIWAMVDGDCDFISNGTSSGSVVTVATSSFDSKGRLVTLTNTGSFGLVEVGDWVVLFDSAFNANLRGIYSVVSAATNSITIRTKDAANAHVLGESVVLNDGRILAIGGSTSFAGCEIYDPTTKLWTTTGSLNTPRYSFGCVVLSDGKVLVIGGYNDSTALTSCEIYDPTTETWTYTSSLPIAIAKGVAVFANGTDVVLFGGVDSSDNALSTVYKATYTTSLSSWNSVAPLGVARENHTVTLLNDGNTAVIVGGENGSTVHQTSQEYDCSAGTAGTVAAIGHGFTLHGAVKTSDNKVFIAGGSSSLSWTAQVNTALYDPSLNTWSAGTNLPNAALNAKCARVSSTIMVCGGGVAPCTYAGTGTGSPTTIASPPAGNPSSGFSLLATTVFYVIGGDRGSVVVPALDTYTTSWQDNFYGSGSITLASGGMAFARSESVLQQLTVSAAANLTPSVLAEQLDGDLLGGSALAINRKLRLQSNRRDEDGRFMVVAADSAAAQLGFNIGATSASEQSHAGFVLSAGELGTPAFADNFPLSAGKSNFFVYGTIDNPNNKVVAVRRSEVANNALGGNARNASRAIASVQQYDDNAQLELRSGLPQDVLPNDAVFLADAFSLSPEDSLVVVVDGNANKTISIPLFRNLSPTSTIYGASNEFVDADNSGESLAKLWGLSHSFLDHVVWMKARAKALGATASKSVLWRSKRFGREGEVSLRYIYPRFANSAISYDVYPDSNLVDLVLGSGAARTSGSLRASTYIGYGKKDAADGRTMVTVCSGFSVSSATRVASTVTLTLTMPSGLYSVTDHGLIAGQKLFLNSTDLVNFPSGVKTITAVTATTVSYTEAGSAVTTPSLGTISIDVVGESLLGNIVVGDIAYLDVENIPSDFANVTFKVSAKGNQFIQGYADRVLDTPFSTALGNWTALVDVSQISAHPLSGEDVTAFVAAINAWPYCPVEGTVLGTGTGVISLSTMDELASPSAAYQLADSVNYIASQTNPATVTDNYTLVFKEPITSDLSTGSDWINEEIRIVPLTIANVVDWLNSLAPSALSELCEIERTYGQNQVQIATKTVGSGGSVQVTGGSGNSTSFALTGSSSGGSAPKFTTSSDVTLHANQWVKITNTQKTTKNIFSNSSVIQSLTSQGEMTMSAGPALFTVNDSDTDALANITQQGDFAAIEISGITVAEGDWVQLTQGSTSPVLSSSNVLWAKVVRATFDTFWVAATLTEETQVHVNYKVIDRNSILPDDVISFNSSAMGANKGDYVVEYVGGFTSNSFANTNKIKVRKITGSISSSSNVALTDGSTSVVVSTGPETFYKRVERGIVTSSGTWVVDSDVGMDNTGAIYGSNAVVLDKLGFDTAKHAGVDGYQFNEGLVARACEVVYGNESIPYSGVASVNSQIEINTPRFRSLSFSFSVRPTGAISLSTLTANIQNAVMSFVNGLPVGLPISLSEVLTQVQSVTGVQSASLVSPSLSTSNQNIALQSDEKSIVVNSSQVTITFVGV